jgi:hypothetical protein
MALAWKMLIPLALMNIAVVATEVLVWREFELENWILAVFGAINFVLAFFFLILFFRIITANYYRLPRRVRLVSEVSVPSLPAPGSVVTP